jgi:hypothetical protein
MAMDTRKAYKTFAESAYKAFPLVKPMIVAMIAQHENDLNPPEIRARISYHHNSELGGYGEGSPKLRRLGVKVTNVDSRNHYMDVILPASLETLEKLTKNRDIQHIG